MAVRTGALLVVASFLLIFFAQLAFSTEFEDWRQKYGDMFKERIDSWWQIALLAIFSCLFFNVFIYMAAMAFQSQELKRYAYSEFLQVSASSMMIFFSVELLYTLVNGTVGLSALDFVGSILGTGQSKIDCAATSDGKFILWKSYPNFGSGPLGAFKCKIQEKIKALERAYNNIYAANMKNERLEMSCFNLFGVPVYCGSWDLSLHIQVEKSHLLANKIVGLLIPLHSLYVLAEYLQRNMLSVFLPAGLVLRVFPFTRGVGGLFIAIAIGFFFIFPVFVILTDPTFVKEDAPKRDMQEGMCFTGFKGATVLLTANFGVGGGMGESELDISRAETLIYELTVGILFYPFIAFVITLIFIRAATPLLGGDLGELMRMVSRLG
ncbi:MAG: hypothetical protein N3G22_03925 [Candidatus Micrarchaeota archaeon]|nr:hypothetical protein [Candidatus Micrarchaeota archaeon]